MRPKLFLIDAMGLIFRAYYAMIKSPRYTTKGLNTSAILGFTNMFYELVKNEKPTHIAVAFDTGAPTFRHAEFQEYKANREATPHDIINAVPYIKRILEAFRVPIVEMDGYEADDVVVMNLPSLIKFESLVKPGGNLFVNSSMIDQKATRDDINVYYVPAGGNPRSGGDLPEVRHQTPRAAY